MWPTKSAFDWLVTPLLWLASLSNCRLVEVTWNSSSIISIISIIIIIISSSSSSSSSKLYSQQKTKNIIH